MLAVSIRNGFNQPFAVIKNALTCRAIERRKAQLKRHIERSLGLDDDKAMPSAKNVLTPLARLEAISASAAISQQDVIVAEKSRSILPECNFNGT